VNRGKLWRGAVAVAMLAACGGAAAEEPSDLEALVRDGRHAEAIELARRRHPEDAGAAARDVARALLSVTLESDDSYLRWFALRAARQVDDPALAPHARKALELGDRYDQSLALDVLLHTDAAGSREQFLAAVESPFRSLRVRGLRGLALAKDPELADVFIRVLSEDSDPDLRAFAVRALAATGSPQAQAGLYRALEDEIAAVQEEAVQALVALHSEGLTNVLRHRLAAAATEDRVRAVRLAAFSDDPALTADLVPLLADPEAEVRARAAAAILAIHERAGARR
jgi:HEAT repeat protein